MTADRPSRGGGSGGPARTPGRRPGRSDTRADILDAARELFAEKGYDGASVRGIARMAGVDPALVHHFYGDKMRLFAAALEFPFDPALAQEIMLGGPREEIGQRAVRTLLWLWGSEETRPRILAFLRTAMTNEEAAASVRDFVSEALFGPVADALEVPRLRVQLAVGHVIGVGIIRYVIGVEPLASASEDELMELLAPMIQRYVDG